jgi:RNA polymerase sigma-70 factor (ECF subfamily)
MGGRNLRSGGGRPREEGRRPDEGGQAFGATLNAARGGEAWALECIYQRHSPRVAGYLRSHGVPDVGGATNDVFLRVFTRLTTFEGDEDGFRSWMFTIAHHLMVDELRRAARRPKIADVASIEEHVPGGDTEEDALAGMGRQRIEALLARLSTDQRAVVLLRVVEDLSIEQVPRALGKRPTAVKALQHRALATLRRLLVDEEVSP